MRVFAVSQGSRGAAGYSTDLSPEAMQGALITNLISALVGASRLRSAQAAVRAHCETLYVGLARLGL